MRDLKRRICWPNPDATCLEGGCAHCADHPLRSYSTVLRYAKQARTLPDRCGGSSKPAMDAFNYGSWLFQ